MGICLKEVVLVLCCAFVLVKSKAVHTSGKLDFAGSAPETSVSKNEKTFPLKVSKTLDAIIAPSTVINRVSCGPTGCNTTHSNNSLEAEVVVHVQTKVNFDHIQQKKALEDASDVPIVVGYKSSTLDDTPDDEQLGANIPNYSTERSAGNHYGLVKPLYDNSYVASKPNYNRRQGQSTGIPYYGPSTYRSSSNDYYGTNISPFPVPSGYQGVPRGPNSYFHSSTSRPLEVNDLNSIRPSLPVLIPNSDRRNHDYNRENGMELQIPYFEHSYNKHYFNEEPPPQTIWFGKSNTHNPVEFRNIQRNQWRPSFWNGRNYKYAFSDGGSSFVNAYPRSPSDSLYNQPVHYRNSDRECSCRDRVDMSDSPNSYAASSVNHHIAIPNKDPGALIDDKLAPLN